MFLQIQLSMPFSVAVCHLVLADGILAQSVFVQGSGSGQGLRSFPVVAVGAVAPRKTPFKHLQPSWVSRPLAGTLVCPERVLVRRGQIDPL